MDESSNSQSRLAYRKLESLIVTLKLAPGALVTEKELISLCGLGRTPVREAIQKLEWQGLMAVKPRAGLIISSLQPAHYHMIKETRLQIEPIAARMVANGLSPEVRQELLACAQTMTSCSATGDIEAFLSADKTFDEILEKACPNPYFAQALGPLQTHARRYWFRSATVDSLDRAVTLHVRVIRAILKEDGVEAEKAMRELLEGLAGTNADT
jgi:DNA-binding GntR family transcriptional regulator